MTDYVMSVTLNPWDTVKVATWFCVAGDERVSRDSILISQKSVPCVVWIVWRYKKTDDYGPIGIECITQTLTLPASSLYVVRKFPPSQLCFCLCRSFA